MKHCYSFRELLPLLRDSSPPEVIFVVAAETLRRRRALRAIENECRQIYGSAERYSIEARSASVEQLRCLLLEVSLFSKARLIELRDYHQLPLKKKEQFDQLFSSSFAPNLLICSGEKLLKSNPLVKHLKSKGVFLEMAPLEGENLRRWIRGEFKREGVEKISREAVEALLSSHEASLEELELACHQLALFVNSEEEISVDTVHRFFASKSSTRDFALLDAITSNNPLLAEQLFGELLQQGRSPFLLVSLLFRSFSTYLQMRRLLDAGTNPSSLGKALGVPHWLLKKHLAAARNYSTADLRRALRAIALADTKLKGYSLGVEAVLGELAQALLPVSRST